MTGALEELIPKEKEETGEMTQTVMWNGGGITALRDRALYS